MQTDSKTEMTSVEQITITATCDDGKSVDEVATAEPTCVEDISLFAVWATETYTNSSFGEWDFVQSSATSVPPNTPNPPSRIGDITPELDGALAEARESADDTFEGLNVLRGPTVLQPPTIDDLHAAILNREFYSDSDSDSDCDSAYETCREELDDEPLGYYTSSLLLDGVRREAFTFYGQ